MPLVFTQNEATASGHSYDDRTGESYEYPATYRNMVRAGELFVYYRGRQGRDGTRLPQVYFGAGVVGQVRQSGNLLKCDILDHRPFDAPVPFRDADGYLEDVPPGQPGYFFVRGVRPLSQQAYDRIAALGFAASPESADTVPAAAHAWLDDSQLRRRVEDCGVAAAVEHLSRRFPGRAVQVQARNNPGFDVLVPGGEAGPDHFCEAKGTVSPVPAFFLSEGERQFAAAHASSYTLVVAYDVDLQGGTHRVAVHDGALDAPAVALSPAQWAGRFATPG